VTISLPISPNNVGKDWGPKGEKSSTNEVVNTDCNSDFSTCKPLPSLLLSIIVLLHILLEKRGFVGCCYSDKISL
jgi:hypothetical protein